MDASRKEDLVNNHFMPADVRMQYEHERAESSCSLSSSWEGTIQGQQYPSSACGNGLVMENRTMQSSDWDKDHDSSHQDLIYANEWSSTVSLECMHVKFLDHLFPNQCISCCKHLHLIQYLYFTTVTVANSRCIAKWCVLVTEELQDIGIKVSRNMQYVYC